LPNGFDPDPRVYREALSLVKNSYEVTILAWDREMKFPLSEVKDGIRIERLRIQSTYGKGTAQLPLLLLFWAKVVFRAFRMSFDCIHCHDFNTLPPGFVLSKVKRKPIIFDAHESYHEMLAPNVLPAIKTVIAYTERILIRHIDRLITVGSILEAEYKRRGAKATCVVGNWKSLEEFQVSPDRVVDEKRTLGIPPERLVVSYVGYFEEGRGLQKLIEAVKERKTVHLIIGGKGQLEKEIRALVHNADNITFLGFVKPERIPLYTAMADVIYYGLESDSANNKYSAPNKLFEALAAGKAVVTGRLGEIAKIVKEEQCGISLPGITRDTLHSALDTIQCPETLTMYKRNASRAGEQKYNWNRAERELLNMYNSVLQQ